MSNVLTASIQVQRVGVLFDNDTKIDFDVEYISVFDSFTAIHLDMITDQQTEVIKNRCDINNIDDVSIIYSAVGRSYIRVNGYIEDNNIDFDEWETISNEIQIQGFSITGIVDI